jgi:uncharacterized protein YkwD
MNLAEPVAGGHVDRHSVQVMRRMWALVLLGLLCLSTAAIPTGAAHAVSAADDTAARASTTLTGDQFESRLLARVNTRRERHGCRPIRSNAALAVAAARHSTAMSDRQELSHRLAGEPDLGPRVVNAGYTRWRMLAENLAWGQSTPGAVFRAWLHSSGHRANLDNCRLRDIGIGVVIRSGRPWVTADFGRRHR